jgi:hypothetical protein
MAKHKRLWDLYRFPGFYPEHTVSGIYGDPKARVIGLIRRGKKRSAGPVVVFTMLSTTEKREEFAIFPVATCGFTWTWKSAESSVAGARR